MKNKGEAIEVAIVFLALMLLITTVMKSCQNHIQEIEKIKVNNQKEVRNDY